MPFGDHLEELRRRLIFAILGVLPIVAVTLYFGRALLDFLMRPIEEALLTEGISNGMQVTNVFEYFNAYLKLSLIMAIVVGAPWIMYQLWRFVAPGLHAYERRFAYIVAPLSLVLTILSAVFMYKAMLPVVLAFAIAFNSLHIRQPPPRAILPADVTLPTTPLLGADPADPAPGQMWFNIATSQLRIAVPDLPPGTVPAAGSPAPTGVRILGIGLSPDNGIPQQYKVSEYLGMVLGFSLAFAVAFQMPILVLLLGWIGLLTPTMLGKYRRHAIMICAILGAVLTPADPISMFVLAIPLYFLYELGGFLLRVLPADRVVSGTIIRRSRRATVPGADGGSDGDGGSEGGS